MAEVPGLLTMWATDLNGSVDPAAVGVRSRRAVWWRCLAGHVWQAAVASKAAAPGRCGRCPKVSHPTLAIGRPELMAQWAAERNTDLDPESLRCGSTVRAWWRCAAGHLWQARIDTRALRGRGCPTCAGGRIDAPRLSSAAPWLLPEWAADLNPGLIPSAVSARSGRLVWWRCPSGHVWKQRIADRTRGRGCPACFATRGVREVEVLQAVAAATGLQYAGHPVLAPPVRGFRDLADEAQRVVIEYDERAHQSRVIQDQALTAELLAAGYTVVRIRERGLPDVGGLAVEVAPDDAPGAIAAQVAGRLATAGVVIRPLPPSRPVPIPRQRSAPPMRDRALYPEHDHHRSALPAPWGRRPVAVRDGLQAALAELLSEGISLNTRGLGRRLAERTGASRSYANQVVAEARRHANWRSTVA